MQISDDDNDEYWLMTPPRKDSRDSGSCKKGARVKTDDWRPDHSLDAELQLLELRQLELTHRQRGLK